jgi:DNA-binding transcriptional LysR family regulator
MNLPGADRLSDAEVFLAVADAGGFSGAARVLGRSQPSVSRRVAALEARLGVRLVERTTRRVRLTEAGALFHARCKDAVATLRDAEAAVQDAQAVVRGALRVSAPPAWARARLAPLLPELAKLHPELTLELVLLERYVDLVEEGIDVAIRMGPLRDSSLVARRIATARFVLCAAPDYVARVRPRRVADLRRCEALVLSTSSARQRWPFRHGGQTHAVEPNACLRTNDVGLLREAALAGRGVTVLPSDLVVADLAAGRLVELLPGARLPRVEVFALLPTRRHAPTKARAFVDFLAKHLANEQAAEPRPSRNN